MTSLTSVVIDAKIVYIDQFRYYPRIEVIYHMIYTSEDFKTVSGLLTSIDSYGWHWQYYSPLTALLFRPDLCK
jgi:hypothetical protein